MADLPPHITANVDQWSALVRDLTDRVRDHRQRCDIPACAGADVYHWLYAHLPELPMLLALCLIDRGADAPPGDPHLGRVDA